MSPLSKKRSTARKKEKKKKKRETKKTIKHWMKNKDTTDLVGWTVVALWANRVTAISGCPDDLSLLNNI